MTKTGKERIQVLRHLLENKPDAKEQHQAHAFKTQIIMQEALEGKEKTGRRVDLQVTTEDGQERPVDTSVTHPSNQTNILKAHKHAKLCLRKQLGIDTKHQVPRTTPALDRRVQDKIDTYATLMAITEKQYSERRRPSKPKFVPAVATTHAELAPDLIQFMEWITAAYKATLKNAPPRADGRKPAELTATFRQHLRQKVLMSITKGTARMLRDAGLSRNTCRKYG